MVKKIDNWNFLIEWSLEHTNALQALSILKYLNNEHDFYNTKTKAIDLYKRKKYPVNEIEIIEYK